MYSNGIEQLTNNGNIFSSFQVMLAYLNGKCNIWSKKISSIIYNFLIPFLYNITVRSISHYIITFSIDYVVHKAAVGV